MERNDLELGLPPAIDTSKSPPLLHGDLVLEMSVIGSAR